MLSSMKPSSPNGLRIKVIINSTIRAGTTIIDNNPMKRDIKGCLVAVAHRFHGHRLVGDDRIQMPLAHPANPYCCDPQFLHGLSSDFMLEGR